MANFDISRLSKEMLDDVNEFKKSGNDAIYCLGKGEDMTIDQIIMRIQSSNISDIALSGLNTIEEWKNSPSPLKDIRTSVSPLSNTNKYSSYALKEKDSCIGKLRFPLCSTFFAKNILFSKKTFPKYKEIISKIENSYKIKINEVNYGGEQFKYKRTGKVTAFLKNKFLGTLNLCLKICRRKKRFNIEPSYKGKITISTTFHYNDGNAYVLSEHEKLTKIIDGIVNITTSKLAKQEKMKLDNKSLFYSRLYAEVLLSRAINYGDKISNRNTESALTLQMSNVLASMDVTPQQLKTASQLGLKVAQKTIKKLGITVEDIKQSVLNAGYTYKDEPTTIEDALLPQRENIKTSNILGITTKPHLKLEDFNPEKNKDKNKENNDDSKNNKTSEKQNNELDPGVKFKNIITKKSAKKYIDETITNCFTKYIERITKALKKENLSDKKNMNLKHNYDFIEHISSFYKVNVNKSLNDVKSLLITETKGAIKKENAYAHYCSSFFIKFRNDIVDGIFGDKDFIENIDNKKVSTIINENISLLYGSNLSKFTNDLLKSQAQSLSKSDKMVYNIDEESNVQIENDDSLADKQK